MTAPGSLGSHSAHFVIFGGPALALGAFVAVQEIRGRRRAAIASTPVAQTTEISTSRISAWQWVAGAGMAVAGITHATVIRQHFAEYALYGVFFTALMATQLLLAGLLLFRPSVKLYGRVSAVSFAVVCLWLLSRTSGLPIGPHPWQPETFGRLDVLASVAELATAAACAVLILQSTSHRPSVDTSRAVPPRDPQAPAIVWPDPQGHGFLTGPLMRAVRWLPRGHPLPDALWLRRHTGIVRFALVQAVGVGIFGYLRGFAIVLCLADVALVGFPALLAHSTYIGRQLRTVAATISLMLASVTIVDLSGGVTEAHFHFFVMVGVVALYQDWTAFGVCIFIVVLHHAVMGVLLPRDVYGSPAEQRNPIFWAFVHGAFILAMACTQVLAWRNYEEQSLSDSLTRLFNRGAFNERLAKAVADIRQPVTVLFLDLDHFKNINDSYGHAVGDHALQAAAGRMVGCMRQTDTLARLGGDEFAIVVQGPQAFGPALAARISSSLQAPVVVDGITVFVRASIGVADTEQTKSRVAGDLLRCADLAMYMAKSSGKNAVVVYDAQMDEAVRERAELAAALGPALSRGQFAAHYQPVVIGKDGVLVGVEALLRWEHPTRGKVAPDVFVPLAEGTGDIINIGLWILRTAATQVVEWNRLRPDALSLAVNVSPVQIGQGDFVDSVLTVLENTGLDPALLVLEVTEGLRLHDWKSSCERLNQLRSLGVRVAIDDFGTGYSSLSYLADLPADIVKIDQSFVRNLHQTGGSALLVSAVMDLSRSLGLEVIAEGVETAAQQAELSRLGCPQSQGYLFSAPLSATDFTEMMRDLPRPLALDPMYRSPAS